jgi:hypothetical protein
MSIPKIAQILFLSIACAATALAGELSDNELKIALVGSWVTPPDSGGEVFLASRQVFLDDGTTQLFIYPTAECRVPIAAIEGRWTVQDSVLSTQVTGTTDPRLISVGQIQQVTIVTIEQDRVVFDADDQLFVREKSETCYPPGAHRT